MKVDFIGLAAVVGMGVAAFVLARCQPVPVPSFTFLGCSFPDGINLAELQTEGEQIAACKHAGGVMEPSTMGRLCFCATPPVVEDRCSDVNVDVEIPPCETPEPKPLPGRTIEGFGMYVGGHQTYHVDADDGIHLSPIAQWEGCPQTPKACALSCKDADAWSFWRGAEPWCRCLVGQDAAGGGGRGIDLMRGAR